MSCHIMTGGKQIKMKVDPATVWGEIICWEGHNELTDAAPLIHETIRHHNISGDLDLALEWRLQHLHLLCPCPTCGWLLTQETPPDSWWSPDPLTIPEHVSSTLARPSPAQAQPAHSQLWRLQLFCFLAVVRIQAAGDTATVNTSVTQPLARDFNADSAE